MKKKLTRAERRAWLDRQEMAMTYKYGINSTMIGRELKLLREDKHLTLDEVASSANISKSYLWDIENNEKRNITVVTLVKIANALGIHIYNLKTLNNLIENLKKGQNSS